MADVNSTVLPDGEKSETRLNMETENNSRPNQTMQPAVEPRENLVSTAVRFLENPKVRQSPFVQRRQFLEKKGLTKEEIELAIQRSGMAGDETAVPSIPAPTEPQTYPGNAMVQTVTPVVYQVPAPASIWQRLRDWINAAVFTGGVLYAVYQFYKHYIAPWWFGGDGVTDPFDSVNKSIAELNKTVLEAVGGLGDVKQHVARLDDSMKITTSQKGIDDVKDDLKTIKGLLLNKKQFPRTPLTTPVVPAWQLQQVNPVSAKLGLVSSNSRTNLENEQAQPENGQQSESSTNQIKTDTPKDTVLNGSTSEVNIINDETIENKCEDGSLKMNGVDDGRADVNGVNGISEDIDEHIDDNVNFNSDGVHLFPEVIVENSM